MKLKCKETGNLESLEEIKKKWMEMKSNFIDFPSSWEDIEYYIKECYENETEY